LFFFHCPPTFLLVDPVSKTSGMKLSPQGHIRETTHHITTPPLSFFLYTIEPGYRIDSDLDLGELVPLLVHEAKLGVHLLLTGLRGTLGENGVVGTGAFAGQGGTSSKLLVFHLLGGG